jgi:hypothetical protein
LLENLPVLSILQQSLGADSVAVGVNFGNNLGSNNWII